MFFDLIDRHRGMLPWYPTFFGSLQVHHLSRRLDKVKQVFANIFPGAEFTGINCKERKVGVKTRQKKGEYEDDEFTCDTSLFTALMAYSVVATRRESEERVMSAIVTGHNHNS
jgi:hypothetical protein